MSEERIRILKMLEEGKISAEEANELLGTIEETPSKELVKSGKARFIKILVEDEEGEKVNITLPFALAKTALNFVPKSAKTNLKEQHINLEEILEQLEGELDDNTLVNINDGDSKVLIKVVSE